MQRSVAAQRSQYDVVAVRYRCAALQTVEGAFSFCVLCAVGLADHEFSANRHAAGNHLRNSVATVKRPAFGHKAGAQQID